MMFRVAGRVSIYMIYSAEPILIAYVGFNFFSDIMVSPKMITVISHIFALVPLSKSIYIEEIVTVSTEANDLSELGPLLNTVASMEMYGRLNNLELLFSQIRDIGDTLNLALALPKASNGAQIPLKSTVEALRSLGGRVEDVITRARRVAGGRHKGFGTAFASYEWARITIGAFETLLDPKHPESYYAAIGTLKLQALNLQTKFKLAGHVREVAAIDVARLPTKLGAAAKKPLEAQGKFTRLEAEERHIMDLFKVLEMKIDKWEATFSEITKSINHVVVAINAMFPNKPIMGNGGDMKNEPRYIEVAAALSGIHNFHFQEAHVKAMDLQVNIDNFMALKRFTLDRLSKPLGGIKENLTVKDLAERFEGLAELEQVIRLTQVMPERLLERVETVMEKSKRKLEKLTVMRHSEIDELINDADKYIYRFDVGMPGNVFSKASVVVHSIEKELSFWKNIFGKSLSLSRTEFEAIREILRDFDSKTKQFLTVSRDLYSGVLQTQERLIDLSYLVSF